MSKVIASLFVLVFVFLVVGVLAAKKYKLTNNSIYLYRHRSLMKTVFFLVVAGVIFLEISIRLKFIPSGGHKFFWVHLVFAIPFFFLATMLVFWKDGMHSPGIHKKLGYFCVVTFIGTLVTGILFFAF